MEIQETKAYSIPFINIDQNSTLMFKDAATRDGYFNVNGTVLTNNVVKDVWRLYVDYLMTEGTPYPKAGVYNYFRFKLKRGGYLFFYVYDYEIKGAGQILYKLKLDTLQTYYLHSNDFQPIGEQLVYREHKDRFNILKKPIIDQTLESLDIKPRIVTTKWEDSNPAARRLVLKKYGGSILDNEVLSQPIYAYDVHGNILDSGNAVDDLEFNMPVGWGVSTPELSGLDNWIHFNWTSNGHALTQVAILNKVRSFRFVKWEDGNHYLQLISGESLATGIGISGNGAEVVGVDVRLKGDGKLTLHVGDLVQTKVVVHIEKDLGMYYADNFHDRPDKRFATYDPSATVIRPYLIGAIDYTNSKNQKVIEIPKNFSFNKYTLKTGDRGAIIPLNTDLGINEITVPMSTKSFTTTFSNAMTRVKHNDPKLYHSQIRPLYLTYLSESILLRRESLLNSTNVMHFKYKVNDSDYSKMLLYSTDDLNQYQQSELYELSKVINLNNEVALIKDDFSQYLDSNYRSDQRLQELQISKANRDLVYKGVGQVVSVGGGIAAGAISGSIVPGVGTVAGAVAGAATGIVKGALNIAQGIQNLNQLKEEIKLNYEQKIKSLQYSLINVTGATPEFNALINSDRMKLFEFSPITEELDYLDLYFHNFGYQTLEFKIPNLRSRKYFNFIQMELVNYHINNRLITAEVIEDIRLRFQTGVTLFHYNETDMIKIDTQKQYENYERRFDAGNDYYDYAYDYYVATNNWALFADAWESSWLVDPLEISVDSIVSNPRGRAQYPNRDIYGVIIPEGVTSIGDYAFYYCQTNNQPLVIPDSVTSIGEYAFYYWVSNNQPLVIPNGVTTIGGYAFQNWSANTHPIIIPNSVTSIGSGAFAGRSLSPYVEIKAITPPTLASSFAFYHPNNAPIYVPDESVTAYKTATNWVDLADRIFPISDK